MPRQVGAARVPGGVRGGGILDPARESGSPSKLTRAAGTLAAHVVVSGGSGDARSSPASSIDEGGGFCDTVRAGVAGALRGDGKHRQKACLLEG